MYEPSLTDGGCSVPFLVVCGIHEMLESKRPGLEVETLMGMVIDYGVYPLVTREAIQNSFWLQNQ